MEAILGVSLVILVVVFYFLPALIAGQRNVVNKRAIDLINIFFGWTILGWIAALIWAVTDAPKAPEVVRGVGPQLRDCPACYSKIDPRATICPHCRSAVELAPHESGRMINNGVRTEQ